MSRPSAPRWALTVFLLATSPWGTRVVEGVSRPFLQEHHQSGPPASSREPQRTVLGLATRLRAGASTATAAAVAGAADRPTFNLPGGGGDAAGGNKAGGALGAPKKKGDLGVRTRSTLILVGSFLAIIIKLKQTGCAILVAFLQWAVFREGLAIVRDEVTEVLLEAEKGGGRSLRRRQWGVFWVLGLAVYGKMLAKEIAGVADPSPWMVAFCRWHIPACAALYVRLLLQFISSLRSPPLIMYQLGQLAAAHLAAFFVLPSALVSFAARAGLFWFVIASASVIINDIMAYICGRLFGRTPLTVLSPKKTREGFVGAALCTSVTGWLVGRWLSGVDWLVAPSNVMLLGRGETMMDVGTIFSKTVQLPWLDLMVSRAEIHAFWIALMASLIGPFGGFLASGLKRAYNVKDFGDTIPGHGGAGDRFDCQVMLLPLVYFYLKAFAPSLDI